jgi:hypothetical protein
MGLFGGLTNALGGITGLLGGVSGALAGVRGVGQTLGVNLLPAQGPTVPTFVSAPGSLGAAMSAAPRVAQRSMPLIQRGMSMLTRGMTATAAASLIKIAETLGRRTMTLREAVRIIKKTGRFMGPVATAAAIGLTLDEMAELIFIDSSRKRRRMNPANVTALRRSMRRISSFHRLCQKADSLRGTSSRRRRPAPASRASGQIVQVK